MQLMQGLHGIEIIFKISYIIILKYWIKDFDEKSYWAYNTELFDNIDIKLFLALYTFNLSS